MYENDEDIPSEEETEFENTAVDLQQQFKKLSAKFQQILLQESSLSHRTSETCQVQQLMIDDLKNEMKELQQQLEEAEDCEKLLKKKDIKPETVDLTDEDAMVKEIKCEISEDHSKTENDEHNLSTFQEEEKQYKLNAVDDDMKQDHSPKVKQQQFNGGDIKPCAKTVKEDFQDFDIESEITPSFIMKKSGGSSSPTITTTPPLTLRSVATPSPKRSFNDVYIERTQQQQQQHQQPATKIQTETNKADTQEQLSILTQSKDITQFVNQQQQQQFVEQQQQVQQEDEWLCIQNELNLMNDKQQKQTAQNDVLYNQQGTNNQMNDLFPNGCMRNIDKTAHNSNIGEFFDSTDDDEVQRSVETRLDAMFGESPVPLGGGKNDTDTQDIENNLDEIFGNTKSPVGANGVGIIDAIKNKRLWEEEMANANNFSNNKNFYDNDNDNNTMAQQYDAQQQQQQQQQPHQIQLNCNNNPRWMQNMEAQFSDFNSNMSMNGSIVANDVVNNATISRKRHWNQTDQLLNTNDFVGDDLQAPMNKKGCCNGNTNLSASSTISSTTSSSSPMSQQQQVAMSQRHQHDMLNADLLLHDVPDFAQQQQQQQQHFNEQQQQTYGNMMIHNVDMHTMQQQQQHYANNIQQEIQQAQQTQDQQLINTGNNVEFDDDISRHVQNAIDSILNLQNSESDSLPFSLDHSMGSLLGDSILDDRQHNSVTTTTNMVPIISTNDSMNTNMLMANNCGGILNKRRINLVDDLSDCLISGVSQCGDNASNILLNQHAYQAQQQQMPHTLINQQQQQQQHQYNQHASTSNHMLHHQHQHQQQVETQSVAAVAAAEATTTTTNSNANGAEVLNDFSCMVANIDEAVKSIMSS